MAGILLEPTRERTASPPPHKRARLTSSPPPPPSGQQHPSTTSNGDTVVLNTSGQSNVPATSKDAKPLYVSRKTGPQDQLRSTNPLELKPNGNLLMHHEYARIRQEGLGTLAMLPDELLLTYVFGALDGEDLVRIGAVSKTMLAWSHVEGIWKGVYISKTGGRLLKWHGSWRSSYIATFLRPPSLPESEPLPSVCVKTPTIHSDVLFQPSLCASFDPRPLFLTQSFVPNIPRLDGRGLTPFQLPEEPAILTHLMDDWGAMDSTSNRWTLEHLTSRFPTAPLLRAEATLTSLSSYKTYHDDCPLDESPLYLFESQFVEKTEKVEGVDGGLGRDYEVPECFREDLFEVLGSERPDYRWLIVGPTRSGSTWHQDPNGTSAWNACTVGAKAWIMFPPHLTPPGIFVSEDQAEVECPLSLAEWFMSYYKEAKATFGLKAKDPALRGQMREGICHAGEIFFVPSGWWHIVVNLTPAVAVTQNFVSRRELPAVLRFMRDRPDQVSGFKLVPAAAVPSTITMSSGPGRTDSVVQADSRRAGEEEEGEGEGEGGLGERDECVEDVFDKFCEALRVHQPDVWESDVRAILEEEEESRGGKLTSGQGKGKGKGKGEVGGREKKESLWEELKKGTREQEGEECVGEEGGGFSFGFLGDGEEFEESEDGEDGEVTT